LQRAASISMRADGGVHFGTARHIALTLLVVESPGVIERDQEIEFQLELPGMQETVYGSAVVHHAEHFDDKPSSYELRILHLRAGDEVLLREWVDDMHHGGSSVHPHRHLREKDLSSMISEARIADQAGLPPGAVSTWDARRVASSGPGGRGRRSVRDGMHRHFQQQKGPDPELSDTPEITDEANGITIEITEP